MRPFLTCLGGLRSLMRPLRWKIAVSVVVGLVQVVASLGFVAVSKKVVDIATGGCSEALRPYVFLFVGIMVLQIICRVFARYWENLMCVDAQNSTRREVFERVIRSCYDGKDRFHSGDTVNRLEEDIRVIVDFLCSVLPEMFCTVVQLCAAVAFLFALAPSLAWILIWIMPVAVLGSKLFFGKMRQLTNDIRSDESRVQGHMQENVQQTILVRTMGNTEGVLDRMDSLQSSVREKSVERMNYSAVSRAFMQTGFAAGYALAFLWGVFGLRDGSVTYGLMVAFLQLVGQVQRPVAEVTRQIPSFIRALSSEDRILDLVSLEQEKQEHRLVLEGAPGVLVQDLCFSYPDNDYAVLDNLCFDFKPGEMTVILGHSGVGKSTLVKLLMSLMRPASGKVYLYNNSQRVESGVDTRCNFMYVPQGNSLMSGTIRQNLLMANPDATEDDIKQALHLATADFVLELKDGLDTQCAEIGRGLSEGQAQRIAIARALLRPGGVLLLDECTSALDADTEQQLLSRLHDHYHGTKTIICVTHRPAATLYTDSTLSL